MKLKYLMVVSALTLGMVTATPAVAQSTSQTSVAAPMQARPVAVKHDRKHYPPKPPGVPAELHRKVVHLYYRIHNAYPDASRQRIFLKIADELGIAPRRLWNAYHQTDRTVDVVRPVTDAKRKTDQVTDRAVDRTTDRRSDRATDRASDRRTDRVTDRRTDRVRDRRTIRRVDRARRVRPVRPQRVRRPGRG